MVQRVSAWVAWVPGGGAWFALTAQHAGASSKLPPLISVVHNHHRVYTALLPGLGSPTVAEVERRRRRGPGHCRRAVQARRAQQTVVVLARAVLLHTTRSHWLSPRSQTLC